MSCHCDDDDGNDGGDDDNYDDDDDNGDYIGALRRTSVGGISYIYTYSDRWG